jgi:hypothetical protein
VEVLIMASTSCHTPTSHASDVLSGSSGRAGGRRPDKTELKKLFAGAAWANILALFVAVAALSIQIRDVKAVADHTARIVLGNQLRINYPNSGSAVGPTAEIRGFTPFRDGAHYLIVSLPAGDFIQDGPLKISPTGLWSGYANIGNASAGTGLVFTVRVFHTRDPLPPGSQTGPADAGFSEPITVLRKE